jgi:hypothetical protein
MASVEMLIGLYNNSAIENCIFLHPGTSMSYLSILGDTADFGRLKKDVFYYCLCLSPEIEPGGILFKLQTS